MAQHDYNIANDSFPTVRSDINNVLSAINSSNSGSSRPSSAVAGTIWLDTSGAATAQLLKMYDGAADITLGTINFTANTVDWTDSSVTVSDNSITLAKMASGTDGNIISYDASGDPVAVATGSSGQVLTSAGAGAVPSFQSITQNATHSGEVTGATALTIADNIVDEANLKVSNSPTNGFFLSAQSGNTGGLTWAEAAGGGKINQVVRMEYGSHQGFTSSAGVYNNTGVTLNITPSASNSKVAGFVYVGTGASADVFTFTDVKNITSGTIVANRNGVCPRSAQVSKNNTTHAFLDSPSSTNAQTYTLRLDTGGATGYINSRDSGNLGSYSGIILMEVLA